MRIRTAGTAVSPTASMPECVQNKCRSSMEAEMDLLHVWMIITVAIYNAFIGIVLLKSSGAISLRDLVREKSVAAPVVDTASTGSGASPADTSYSRVSGLAGAVVLSSFVWGLGNVVI